MKPALWEFRCQQCGWVDTRPDKCTNCGSLRGEKPALFPSLPQTCDDCCTGNGCDCQSLAEVDIQPGHLGPSVSTAASANPSFETPYSGHVSVPNPHFFCDDCGRNLWSKRKRLLNPQAAPTIMVNLGGDYLCQRCFLRSDVA